MVISLLPSRRAPTWASLPMFADMKPWQPHGMEHHGLWCAAHALNDEPGAFFKEVCAGVPVASVRGVMFASYPANAPVGPSDPSQYPKQGPHQFKPVRAHGPCVHPNPKLHVHAMHSLRTAHAYPLLQLANAPLRHAFASHRSLSLTARACLYRVWNPCVDLAWPSPYQTLASFLP